MIPGFRPLAELCSIKQGRYLAPNEMSESMSASMPVPVIGGNGVLGYTNRASNSRNVVLVTCRGSRCGLLQWVEAPVWVSNNAIACDTGTDLGNQLLRYLLGTTNFQDVTTGSARPQITIGHLSAKQFEVPPSESWTGIVDLLSTIDDRIALLRETNATLEAVAQALFKSWFVDFDPVRAKQQGLAPAGMDEATAALFPDSFEDSALGLVPKGWACIDLATLTKRFGGKIQIGPFGSQLHASDYVKSGVPVVMPRDIVNRRATTESIARIGAGDADRLSRHKLQAGDIVFSRRGDVERHALITEREVGWLCGTGCLLLRPGHLWESPGYLSMLLDAPHARTWLVQHAVGATMPNLNTGILGSVPVVLPTGSLLRAFEQLMSVTEQQRSRNASMSETLATLRDTLLPRLISGQLRLPEAAAIDVLAQAS